jgi:hypothetical protein
MSDSDGNLLFKSYRLSHATIGIFNRISSSADRRKLRDRRHHALTNSCSLEWFEKTNPLKHRIPHPIAFVLHAINLRVCGEQPPYHQVNCLRVALPSPKAPFKKKNARPSKAPKVGLKSEEY